MLLSCRPSVPSPRRTGNIITPRYCTRNTVRNRRGIPNPPCKAGTDGSLTHHTHATRVYFLSQRALHLCLSLFLSQALFLSFSLSPFIFPPKAACPCRVVQQRRGAHHLSRVSHDTLVHIALRRPVVSPSARQKQKATVPEIWTSLPRTLSPRGDRRFARTGNVAYSPSLRRRRRPSLSPLLMTSRLNRRN